MWRRSLISSRRHPRVSPHPRHLYWPSAARRPAGALHGDVAPLSHQLPPPPADLAALEPHVWPLGSARRGGVLHLGGRDVRDLAATYGTPAYILVEADVRERCRAYRAAFDDGD